MICEVVFEGGLNFITDFPLFNEKFIKIKVILFLTIVIEFDNSNFALGLSLLGEGILYLNREIFSTFL
jgi:hypothetical protein